MSRKWILAVYTSKHLALAAAEEAGRRNISSGGYFEEDGGWIPILWHGNQEGKMIIAEPGGPAIGILTKDGQPKFFN